MNRREFMKTIGVSAASLAVPGCLSAIPPVASGGDRPNILFIMSDDHAAAGISAYGGFLADVAKTPNIDRLAGEGMLFRNCFCTNSICTPSRATILTGKYGHKNGCPGLDMEFDGSQQTFPKLLQKTGYHTGMVGKWHLASEPTGFDYYCVLPGQGDYHNPKLKEKGNRWVDGFDGGERYEGYVSDVIGDFVLKFLENRPKDRPFFLAYQDKAPHDMWEYSDKHAALYEDIELPEPANLFDDHSNRGEAIKRAQWVKIGNGDLSYEKETGHLSGAARKRAQYQVFVKSFLRCVASIDENVGRVLDYLDRAGLAESTIVIYTSDQGAFLGEHGLWDKRFMYEESIRMPFLVRYPQGIKPGGVNGDIVTNVDFAETFLDYAGVSVPKDMQGRSIRPLLEGRTPADWPTSMYYTYSEEGSPAQHYGVRTERYKLIYFYGLPKPEWELYDLQKDPREMNNVYADVAYADVVPMMKSELKRLRSELDVPNAENVP